MYEQLNIPVNLGPHLQLKLLTLSQNQLLNFQLQHKVTVHFDIYAEKLILKMSPWNQDIAAEV
jgi:hypothetical protein